MAARIMLLSRPVSGAAKNAFQDAALLCGGVGRFGNDVRALLALAEGKAYFRLAGAAAQTQAHGFAGPVLAQPALRVARKRGAIEGDQDVALPHARALGGGVKLDLGGDARAVG